MTGSISVFDPTAPDAVESQQLRRPLDALKGKVVGFIDNVKPNSNYLVDDVAELLVTKYGAKAVMKHKKRGASIPVAEEALNDLARQCDLIVAGSGD